MTYKQPTRICSSCDSKTIRVSKLSGVWTIAYCEQKKTKPYTTHSLFVGFSKCILSLANKKARMQMANDKNSKIWRERSIMQNILKSILHTQKTHHVAIKPLLIGYGYIQFYFISICNACFYELF